MKKLIYLAGSHQDRSNWREVFQKKLDVRFKGKVLGIDPFKREIDESKPKAIVGHDLFCIENCDLFLVNAVGSDISFGTAQEIVLAKYWDKGVVIVADEDSSVKFRKRKGKGGRVVKIAIHPFASNFADFITDSYDEAIDWMARFFQGKVKVKTFKETLKAGKEYAEKLLPKDKITREIFKT